MVYTTENKIDSQDVDGEHDYLYILGLMAFCFEIDRRGDQQF